MDDDILRENLEFYKKQIDELKPYLLKIQLLLANKIPEMTPAELLDAWVKINKGITDGVIIASELIEAQQIENQIQNLIGKENG